MPDEPEPRRIPLTHARLVEARVLLDTLVMTEWCWVGDPTDERCKAALFLQATKLLALARDEPKCWRITAAGRQHLQSIVWDLIEAAERGAA